MDVAEVLEQLHKKAIKDEDLRKRLLATKESEHPLRDFCQISTECGLPIYEMDLLEYGESAYAAMRRSTNGGGENSPLLVYEDDAYELFLASLK